MIEKPAANKVTLSLFLRDFEIVSGQFFQAYHIPKMNGEKLFRQIRNLRKKVESNLLRKI